MDNDSESGRPDPDAAADKASAADSAVVAGGSYDVIRRRLVAQAEMLEARTGALNVARVAEFGATEMSVQARTRVRTEHNCVGRDVVQVGDLLVFGYNVFIGLKTQTRVEDVLALYRLVSDGESHTMEPVPHGGSFLDEQRFRDDFDELYRYYRDTRLVQLVHRDGKLLVSFRIGARLDDLRVFRWSVPPDGAPPTYIDNRGERDIVPPASHDFKWIEAGREHIVNGRHPHVNILDRVFVDTIGGDLTVKVEDNTEDGQGIWREPVDDPTQSLSDASFAWAEVGELILIRVLPYKETVQRYLVFNPRLNRVTRIDAIGDACLALPEDHGIIFPGGFQLTTGELKSFGLGVPGLKFKRRLRSPNGEDVLYVFYEPERGLFALLSYNLITKTLVNPILTHGYALAADGTAVVFTAEDEPTRVHPMQIWSTPYSSDEHAIVSPGGQSFLARIGNAELVRGVSDLYAVTRLVREESLSVAHYERLHRAAGKLADDHFWIGDAATEGIADILGELVDSADLIVEEFEKVESIRAHSALALREAQELQASIVADSTAGEAASIDGFVGLLNRIRQQRGHLATIREYRYIDVDALSEMDDALVVLNDEVGERTAGFLVGEDAFAGYVDGMRAVESRLDAHETTTDLEPDAHALDDIAAGLDLLSELVATLAIDDPTVQTRVIETVSDVYADLNRIRALARRRREQMGSVEAAGQFAAQQRLLAQSVTHALGLSTTLERSDEQLARLLVQLEEIEGRFGEHERFLSDILARREEVHDTFSAHRQQLLDAQQARARTLGDAASRMLASIERRTQGFADGDSLNAYLASDALVLKVRDVVVELRALGSAVGADEAEARLTMIRDTALRALRDRTDLYDDGGRAIRLGVHRFGVNTETLDLSLVPRGETLALHLIGTRYFEPLGDERALALKPYWHQALVSETDAVYRAEYLAYCVIESARAAVADSSLSWGTLVRTLNDSGVLERQLRDVAAERYREGYRKGVHDTDAVLILRALVPLIERGDLLRFAPGSRALAQMVWAGLSVPDAVDQSLATLVTRAQSAERLHEVFGNRRAVSLLEQELLLHVEAFVAAHHLADADSTRRGAAAYLAAELGREDLAFIASRQSTALVARLGRTLHADVEREFATALVDLDGRPGAQRELATAWLEALIDSVGEDAEDLRRYVPEAAVQRVVGKALSYRQLDIDVAVTVEGLLGEHARVAAGSMTLTLDEFLSRLGEHVRSVVPGYHAWQSLRQSLTADARAALRLEEFKPRPLSSFVRNKLVDEAYLPLVGDNLAKQIGTLGESKRSDLNGLLMMISPPGYGKTTLMEYVASRLGLAFMKINGPALGHETVSLDPATAPDSTARAELEKLGLALEMGENVMLYIDDIQHTHPAFLQKFISLCDSTRRIEGVWRGVTQTYDLRGRKFCVVMAGNPYTESGESFRVPDMLANRADVYNLGDVLSGRESQFELSYLENALSSNPVLSPLATRDMTDVYRLVDLALGRDVATTSLSHAYSGAEIGEITRVLQHLFAVRDVVLAVNREYIASAAQDDRYRTEPRFLLQGSYRNMNRLTEKVSAAMNDAELQALIDDHYRGEAQLLTQGAEANLLKLGELRGTLTDGDQARWTDILGNFRREQAMGGDSSDAGQRIASMLADLVGGVGTISERLTPNAAVDAARVHTSAMARLVGESVERLEVAVREQQTQVSVTNTPSPEFAATLAMLNETIEHTLFPLVRSMDRRIGQDLDALGELKRLREAVLRLEQGESP